MPCVVRRRWDKVRYYNELCNDGKSFCYWYVTNELGPWQLLYKDCECPCDCEDPERVGYNKSDHKLSSTECPNYRIPDRGLGDVSELPEDLRKEKLPSTYFVKTKCAYAIKDCRIRFNPSRDPIDLKIYYHPRVIYQYHDKLPCIYIYEGTYYSRSCTQQSFAQCEGSPGYNVTYHIDPIPEEDFRKLGLWEAPCNIEIRCFKSLNIKNGWDAVYHWADLEPFFNNFNFHRDLYDIPYSLTRGLTPAFYLSSPSLPSEWFLWFQSLLQPLLPKGVQSLLQPFLPEPIQKIGETRIHYVFDAPYHGLAHVNHWRFPSSPPPIPEKPPAGSCLYIITSTGEKYVYHTCSEGWHCPEINWKRKEKECPEKNYIVTITDCVGGPITTIPPKPRFPFCAWESVPLELTLTYYEVGENPMHGGVPFVKRVIREVRKAKYYDLLLMGGFWGDFLDMIRGTGKLVAFDPYGFLFLAQESCSFAVSGFSSIPRPFDPDYTIMNNEDGHVKEIYLHIRYWREDVPALREVIEQYLDRHREKCGSTPGCVTVHEPYIHKLRPHNKRAILPVLLTKLPGHEKGARVLATYGLSYVGTTGGQHVYFFNPSLFASGPDKYCKLTYNGYTWVASGTCDRCDVYVEMLNHVMKVCFYGREHPFVRRLLSNLPRGVYFEASRYTCDYTVGDVVRAIRRFWPIEVYLTCPLPLPDSDYFYVYVDFDGSLFLFLPCGANKAVPYFRIDRTKRRTYLIPCTQSMNVECIPQNARRIFWAFVPWVYQPCLCREWTPS